MATYTPPNGAHNYSRPTASMSPRYSRYQIPKSLTQGMGEVDAYTRSVTMSQFLFRRFQEQGWLQADPAARLTSALGLVMCVEDESEEAAEEGEIKYIVKPDTIDPDLKTISSQLGLTAVFTMSSDITALLFKRIGPSDSEITLSPNNITVPVVDSLSSLAQDSTSVRRRDFCCFVRQEKVVLVWSTSADDVLLHASDVETKLMSSVWGTMITSGHHTPRHHRQPTGGNTPWQGTTPSVISETPPMVHGQNSEKNLVVLDEVDLTAEDEEKRAPVARPFLLSHSVMVGLAMCLLMVIECLAVRLIIIEIKALGTPMLSRLGLLAPLPIFMFFTLFFTIVIVGTLFQLVGPMNDVKNGNSRFYSSQPPNIKRHPDFQFPHVTIQMPVYKEGLKGVIIPTIESLMPAIRHYESLGGTASIFVCEDGMQAVGQEVAEMRRNFYKVNNIGWCARPPHGKDGFVRAGKFKKASNMNYCLSFSLRVEDELLRLMKEKAQAEERTEESLSIDEEEELYQQAMQTIIDGDGGKTWAEGNVRMGEIILLIDCDTRVPVDCLSLGALEMEESPSVAIIQHASGVMQVIHSFFENAITYFTNLIYLLIKFSVGNGDCAPFVGHNAFLRWKAIQSVYFVEDGVEKFWSESHVSEDFDMSLRLQTAGFVVRLATYDKGEFKEGVSLTAFDELLRWEKYAYGCSELIFHPVYQWIYRGPFTELFRRFLWSNMKISAKFTILGYIGTYYAIGASLPLSITNYFLTGWIADSLDHSYLPSWDMLCGTLFIFVAVSPIAFAWYRHRLGEKNLFWGLVESFMWMPFFVIFFGGISWHISYALLAHMFCLPIEWSSTAKELESGGFFVGMERVFKAFKYVLFFMACLTGAVIYLALYAPYGWKIQAWPSIFPVANQIVGHVMLPVMTIML
ncbi:glycosyl transferase family group 2-domain-containing protein [Talaromyces proteolyticus]|uniref:Glycosyl transferase family group 2-domain-containing protein n=1 Tax=Talaromyces proteolyticus TaxID=1131652 RepID=A0AAD4KKB3_9EURO|nr:glycosyl transferase family group 2-domain-containing protein [Talaromyces proteolyticus]KAH8690184.1 glycosyl transferase family group 2-domain-containing protein [Talaromyces proteolyticus]